MRRSRLHWTILRPGTIYGAGTHGLFAKIVRLVNGLPVVPVIGPGTEPMRPIYVGDCASAALACLGQPRTIGQTYSLGGKDVVDFNRFCGVCSGPKAERNPCFTLRCGCASRLPALWGGCSRTRRSLWTTSPV